MLIKFMMPNMRVLQKQNPLTLKVDLSKDYSKMKSNRILQLAWTMHSQHSCKLTIFTAFLMQQKQMKCDKPPLPHDKAVLVC